MEDHLNPVMLVFIGYLLLGTLSDEYPCARVSVIFPCHHNGLALWPYSLVGLGTGTISKSTILYYFILKGTLKDTNHCEVSVIMY